MVLAEMDSIEDLKTNFTAVLTSGGGHLSEQQFMRDYRSLIGSNIPYTQLGFKSLRELVQSLGGFYVTRNNFGETVINQGYDEKTAHITSLIARQKRKPGASKGKKRSSSFSRPYAPARKPPMLRRPTSAPPTRPTYTSSTSAVRPNQGSSTPLAPLMAVRLNQGSSAPLAPLMAVRPNLGSSTPPAPLMASAKSPPKPRYSVPPIIPQRQPLSSVQKRLEVQPAKVNVPEARARVVAENSHDSRPLGVVERSTAEASKAKESPKETPEDSTTFVDIQWLHGKVLSRKSSVGQCQSEEVVNVRVSPTAPCDAVTATQPARTAPPPVATTPPPVRKTPPPVKTTPPPVRTTPPPVSKPSPPSGAGTTRQPVIKHSPAVSPPPPTPPPVIASAVGDLFALANRLGLGVPEYKYIERRPLGRGKPLYSSKVIVGKEFLLSSFPDERASPEDAQETVAKLAIAELSKRANMRVASSDHLPASEILERVYSIVKNKDNGTFEDAVSLKYEEEFQMRLPELWLELIENSPQFAVENVAGKAIIYPQNVIDCPIPQLGKMEVKVDINANRIESSRERRPPSLILPACESNWDVFVASVTSTDAWVRLIGEDYDVKYNNLMNEMELDLMNSDGEKPTEYKINEYYVAKFDNCWLRVQLKELAEDGEDECSVLLIDNGEVDNIALTELKVLHDKYLRLPPQAVQCQLAYVDLNFSEAQDYMLSNVIGSSFVAEVLVPPSEGSSGTIVLYNTSVEGEPVNVNFEVLEKIVEKLERPVLPVRHVAFLRMTHLAPESMPHVQVKSEALSLLESILNDLSLVDLVQVYGVNAHPKLGKTKKVIARSERAPKSWRRGKIVESQDARYLQVHFVDYGYKERVLLGNIYDMEQVIPALLKFPVQAVPVNLHGISLSQLNFGVVQRLRELVPDDEFLLGKVTDPNLEPPSVELFMRVQPLNIIASINTDIIFNLEEYSKSEPVIVQPVSAGTTESTTSLLPCYKLPKEGSDFDVFVSISSNPFNFVVQPHAELHAFNDLMKEMQCLYEAQHEIMAPPAAADLKEKATFAVKHPDDEQWYRVSVEKVINASTVTVRYADYGDIGIVTSERLRYLEDRFRFIPALAIRAKLYGVQPKNSDWSVEECISFNSLINEKPFVSKLMQVNPDNSNSTWKVSLKLIDTASSNVDIDVGEEFIASGMAVRGTD